LRKKRHLSQYRGKTPITPKSKKDKNGKDKNTEEEENLFAKKLPSL